MSKSMKVALSGHREFRAKEAKNVEDIVSLFGKRVSDFID